MTAEVHDNTAEHRFELEAEGHIAMAYYDLSGDVVTFTHTEVPPELGGKGIGSKLVRGALDQVRGRKMRVVARCPFVKAYIEKHPDYADLTK
ncbi:GNAT family N-acetyltransferase [Afipia sp. TerB]